MSTVRTVKGADISAIIQMVMADKNPVKLSDLQQRSILDVLQESLKDHSKREEGEIEVRYKLIIDPSEDNSMVRLLFQFGVLQRDNTRIYVCSNFPGDNQLQKVRVRRRSKGNEKAG